MQQPHSIDSLLQRPRRHRAWPALVCSLAWLAGAGALVALPVTAHAQSDAVKELAAPPPIQLPLKPNPEFAKFPRYVGMLGNRQIVLRLGPKTDDPSGVHGEYQYADNGEVILIAGDREDTTLEVEESNDGTHITGNWVGKFAANGVLDGDRMDVDDSNPLPFDLHPLAAGQPLPSKDESQREAAAALKAMPPDAASGAGDAGNAGNAQDNAGAQQSAPSQQSAPAAAAQAPTTTAPAKPQPGHQVNGVSNLTTGD